MDQIEAGPDGPWFYNSPKTCTIGRTVGETLWVNVGDAVVEYRIGDLVSIIGAAPDYRKHNFRVASLSWRNGGIGLRKV